MVSMVPTVVVCHVDEVFVIVTVGLSIPMRRNQNCAQGTKGVQKNINWMKKQGHFQKNLGH